MNEVIVGSKSPIYTLCGTMIATDYNMLIIGERGAFIEIPPAFIIQDNIYMPPTEKWKVDSNMAYYTEFRSKDNCNVKIYYQKRPVGYANYKVGFYYVSPEDILYHSKDGISKFL